MPRRNANGREIADKVAAAALPHRDETLPSQRPLWWWLFFAPGKMVLWLQYMWPGTVANAFGTARRRNVPLVQLLVSLLIYVILLVIIFAIAGK